MTNKISLMNLASIVLILVSATFLNPMAAQQKESDVPDYMKIKRIVIDPGHGGNDIGARGETSRTNEKDLNLQISKKLGEKIKEKHPDIEVLYTRKDDRRVELADRAKFSNDKNADLFIAVHINSSKNKSATGPAVFVLARRGEKNKEKDYFEDSRKTAKNEMEVISYDENNNVHLQKYDPQNPETVMMNELQWSFNHKMSLIFAREIEKQFKKPPFIQSNYAKVQQGAFYVLRHIVCPFIYLELGFISNHKEYLILSNPQKQDQIAEMMAEAFTEYRKIYEHSDDESLMKAYEDLEEPVFNSEVNKENSSEVNDGGNTGENAGENPGDNPGKNVCESADATQDASEWYAVQIMGLGRLLDEDDPALKGLKIIPLRSEGSQIYRYLTAKSSSLEECREKYPQIKKKFPDAFVVKVVGNKIVRL